LLCVVLLLLLELVQALEAHHVPLLLLLLWVKGE